MSGPDGGSWYQGKFESIKKILLAKIAQVRRAHEMRKDGQITQADFDVLFP